MKLDVLYELCCERGGGLGSLTMRVKRTKEFLSNVAAMAQILWN